MGLGHLVAGARPAAISRKTLRTLISPLFGWAGLIYFAALPIAVARDGWRELHACAGPPGRPGGGPCGIYQDTVLKSPNKSRPHINLGRAYFLKGRFDLALREYQQAELVSMDEPEPAHSLAPMLAATNIADMFIQLNRWEAAHEILKQAWLAHPHFSGLALNLSMYYLTRTPPEPEKAEVFLSDAIRHIEEFPFSKWELGKLYFNRAIAWRLMGRCRDMEGDRRRAAKFDPDLPINELQC